MPLSIAVDLAAGCVWARADGRLSEADLLAGLCELVAHPDFRADLPQLFDLSGVEEVHLAATELRRVVKQAAELSEKLGNGRLAIVGDRPMLYGLARMYEVFSDDLGVEVKAFEQQQEARAWLGLPNAARPPR